MSAHFRRKLAEGEHCEALIADLLRGRGCVVERAEGRDQRRGIDLWVTPPGDGRCSVEVKRDARSEQTGRICIELVSVDARPRGRDLKPGWALTCEADWLLIVQPKCGRAFWLRPLALRARLPRWEHYASSRSGGCIEYSTPNDGYCTTGICVPVLMIVGLALAETALGKAP